MSAPVRIGVAVRQFLDQYPAQPQPVTLQYAANHLDLQLASNSQEVVLTRDEAALIAPCLHALLEPYRH